MSERTYGFGGEQRRERSSHDVGRGSGERESIMSKRNGSWTRAGSMSDIEPGGAKAVQLGDEGRSVALFNVEGKIYATDNQCPHMGYPLTRGVVRNGILTCDWHGRRFDLAGGGCFNNLCDDLEVFPVEVRDGEIWIQQMDAAYRRKEEHLNLLWEGLLRTDRWTISKALALMLRGRVPEEEIAAVVVRHFGRHIASSRGPDASRQIAELVNGLRVSARYDGEDRLIALGTAATSAAGEAAERLEVVVLPDPVTWERIEGWVRMFSANGQANRIERCLFTARAMGDQDRILPLLYECVSQPGFLGHGDGLWCLGYLAEIIEDFGWDSSAELVLNMGSKMAGRGRAEPDLHRRDAIRKLSSLAATVEEAAQRTRADDELDEDGLVMALQSADVEQSFDAMATAVQSGVKLERIITTCILLAADRMARTPVNVDGGWACLSTELMLARSLRVALQVAGPKVAIMGLFHVAWQFFSDRWLNIPGRPLSQMPAVEAEHGKGSTSLDAVCHSVSTLDIQGVGPKVQAYLTAGGDGEQLLAELGRLILWNDTGVQLLPTLGTIFDEFANCRGSDPAIGGGHPSRDQLLVGLARYATDVRTKKEGSSSTTMAMRFAQGRTTVDAFDD